MSLELEFPLLLPYSMLPVRIRLERPLSDVELLRLCERQEVLHIEREPDGELDVRPIGGTLAGAVASEVFGQLHKWTNTDGSGKALPSVGFFLKDGSMRGPRIAWLSQEKWEQAEREDGGGFIRECPEFVVEIAGAHHTLEKLQEKMPQWIANGAELAWLVDPSWKTVEVYRPGREVEVLEGGSAVEGEGPVAGFVLELGRIWN